MISHGVMLFLERTLQLIDNHHAVKYHGQSKEEIAEEHLANRQKLGLETVQSFEE